MWGSLLIQLADIGYWHGVMHECRPLGIAFLIAKSLMGRLLHLSWASCGRSPMNAPESFELGANCCLLLPGQGSAIGQRDAPRPTRKTSTSLVLPGTRPEIRLGLGSTAAFLKAEIRW